MKAVLIADDDPIYQFLLTKKLKSLGFTGKIEVADSVELVRSQLNNTEYFGLVFLDVNLKGGSCWDVISFIENEQIERQPPLYLCSASFTSSEKEKIKNHPLVKGAITKPLSNEILSEILDKHLLE